MHLGTVYSVTYIGQCMHMTCDIQPFTVQIITTHQHWNEDTGTDIQVTLSHLLQPWTSLVHMPIQCGLAMEIHNVFLFLHNRAMLCGHALEQVTAD